MMAMNRSPIRLLKRHKKTLFAALAMLYIINVNMNFARRAEVLKSHRNLAQYLGGTECTIEPLAEVESASPESTKTLLASYPGSGKRFSWQVIDGLTNHVTADDWNFSGRLDKAPLTIKTSWPHSQGIWSWDKQMDQVILLIRSPRWALPSFHALRYELDYATTFERSLLRLGFVYTDRPGLEVWKGWRDDNVEAEMDEWVSFIDFWMQGGISKDETEPHDRCKYSEIDCHPKAILDFDFFYQENPSLTFFELSQILDTTANVEVIAAAARVCVLDSVFKKKELHNGNRDENGSKRKDYRFTSTQLGSMESKVKALRDKYQQAPWNEDETAAVLVLSLNNYIAEIAAEKTFEEMMELYAA